MSARRCVRVVITGRVQGVGFRAWMFRQANARALAGWARNRTDGTVEAVLCGPPEIVQDMIATCHEGPRLANVAAVAVSEETESAHGAFTILNDR